MSIEQILISWYEYIICEEKHVEKKQNCNEKELNIFPSIFCK